MIAHPVLFVNNNNHYYFIILKIFSAADNICPMQVEKPAGLSPAG